MPGRHVQLQPFASGNLFASWRCRAMALTAVHHGLAAMHRLPRRAPPATRYFSGRNSSTKTSGVDASGAKESLRWQ